MERVFANAKQFAFARADGRPEARRAEGAKSLHQLLVQCKIKNV